MSEKPTPKPETLDYEKLYRESEVKIEELEQQLEVIIKRYRKLSELYNEAIEKILSTE